jgi:hypothetical protein
MLPKGVPVSPGRHTIWLAYQGRKVYSESVQMNPGSDYKLPELAGVKKPKQKTLTLFLEGGYRNFLRGDVPEKLLPGVETMGASIYHYATFSKWIGLSGGFNYGQNSDLMQLAGQIGLKFTVAKHNLRFFIGPDLLILFLNYTDDRLDNLQVDQKMTLFGPGGEILCIYSFDNGITLGAGIRAHYFPFSHNGTTHDVVGNQAFAALGYSF